MSILPVVLPGTAVFLAGALAALLLGMNAAGIVRTFGRTVIQLTPSLTAISFMVGLAYVTRYSGMDTVLGLSLTRTGPAFPFFGTLLGWLGVALTGTDAGSNVLFGNLQKVTAERLGISPILMASANSSGGVMGKMIDAQSIVVSSAATGQAGREAEIFKVVFKHSVAPRLRGRTDRDVLRLRRSLGYTRYNIHGAVNSPAACFPSRYSKNSWTRNSKERCVIAIQIFFFSRATPIIKEFPYFA